jgi:DNA replication initiation complex subunit (GINS family)
MINKLIGKRVEKIIDELYDIGDEIIANKYPRNHELFDKLNTLVETTKNIVSPELDKIKLQGNSDVDDYNIQILAQELIDFVEVINKYIEKSRTV